MADITPISEEEFIKIAREEGVPLSLASAFWAIESSAGTDSRAMRRTDSDRVGKGSMQLTGMTWKDFGEKGIAFKDATDAQLSRAALKKIARHVRPDGTYDFQAVKNSFFGAGNDAVLAKAKGQSNYYPARDPRNDAIMRGVIAAIDQSYDGTTSLQKLTLVSKDAAAKAFDNSMAASGAPGTTASASPAAETPASTVDKTDWEALRQTQLDAMKAKSAELTTMRDAQLAAANKINDLAGMNPGGVFTEAQATFEALRAAQERVRRNVAAKNYALPTKNSGVAGVLETFVNKVVADQTYDRNVKEVTDLQKAASDYQIILSNMHTNAARGIPSVATQISIDEASRKAGEAATAMDLLQSKQDIQTARLELSAARAQAVSATQQANTALKEIDSERKEQARRETARIKREKADQDSMQASFKWLSQTNAPPEVRRAAAIELDRALNNRLGTLEEQLNDPNTNPIAKERLRRDIESTKEQIDIFRNFQYVGSTNDLVDAANEFLRARSPDGKAGAKLTSLKEVKDVILADKTTAGAFRRYVESNRDPNAAIGNISARVAEMQVKGTPSEMLVAERVGAAMDKLTMQNLNEQSRAKYGTDWATARKGKLNEFAPNSDKIVAAMTDAAQLTASKQMQNIAVKEAAFESDPVNTLHTFPEWVTIISPEGIGKSLAEAKINPKGDAQFIGGLLFAQQVGRLSVDAPTLVDQLASFYQKKAALIADDPTLSKLGIRREPSRYIVEEANGKKYNLANRAQLLQYIERQKRSSALGKSLESYATGLQG